VIPYKAAQLSGFFVAKKDVTARHEAVSRHQELKTDCFGTESTHKSRTLAKALRFDHRIKRTLPIISFFALFFKILLSHVFE
jgi:hypothetical protein